MRLRNWFGFTLIELVIVIMIIAILASLCLATVQNVTTKARLAEIIQQISWTKKMIDLHVLEYGWDFEPTGGQVPMGYYNGIAGLHSSPDTTDFTFTIDVNGTSWVHVFVYKQPGNIILCIWGYYSDRRRPWVIYEITGHPWAKVLTPMIPAEDISSIQ